jgi:hypothetical protein
MSLTAYHAKLFAHELTKRSSDVYSAIKVTTPFDWGPLSE